MRAWVVALLLCGCGQGAPGGDAGAVDLGGMMVDAAVNPLEHLAATGAMTLSPGNMAGQDEDPVVLRGNDGSLYVAWYSNRNPKLPSGAEDKQIFLMRSTDGANWSAPAQITQGTDWAFYPSLGQDGEGGFHLAYWKWIWTPLGCNPSVMGSCMGQENRIVYRSSADGVTWGGEVELTKGPGDWLPSLVVDRVGKRLLVYFAAVARDNAGKTDLMDSTLRLFVLIHDDKGWSAPISLTSVNDDTFHHNTYPNVAARGDGTFLMAWTRYDVRAPGGFIEVVKQPSTVTMVTTSSDGVNWRAPALVGDPVAAIDVFPSVYGDLGGTKWNVMWLSNAPNPNGVVVEMPVGGVFPNDVVQRPELAGYSPRVVATATPGIYFAAWVEGKDPLQKIGWSLVKR